VINKICELNKVGKSQSQIAHELNVNELTVSKYRRRAGLPPQSVPVLPQKTEKEITKRLKRGQSQRVISKQVGVTTYQVRKVGRERRARQVAA
jgi:DNA-binding CsgD family transcriptional regulator